MVTTIKNYLVFILIGAGILFSFLFFLSPKISQIRTLDSRTKAQKEKLAKLTLKLNSLERLDLPELENQSQAALAALPVEADLAYLLFSTRSLVVEAGLTLDDLQFQTRGLAVSATDSAHLARSTTVNLPVVSWKMEISGQPDQLKVLLENMDKTAPLIQVIVADIEVKSDGSMTTALEVESYFLPLPETLGEPEKPLEMISSEEQITYEKISGLRVVASEALAPVTFGKANLFLP